MVTVPNYQALESFYSAQAPDEGDYALVEDEKKVYQYGNGQWNLMDVKNSMETNLYDLNATAIAQLPAHSSSDALMADAEVITNFANDEYPETEHFMLMCKEYSKTFYATVIRRMGEMSETFGEAVVSCLRNVGTIHELSIEKDHMEFWIKHRSQMYCFLLFPYDFGIVEVL